MKRVIVTILTLAALGLLGTLGACSSQTSGSEVGTSAGVALPQVGADTAAGTVQPAPSAPADGRVLLLWEGRPLGESSREACGRLEIRDEGEVSYGPCGGSLTTTASSGAQWQEILTRFASFDATGEEGHLRFEGEGDVEGIAWQSAVARWASATYRELSSGHACAACRTILSWSFDMESQSQEQCAELWITNFGYASLGTMPCAGGETEVIGQGWLETTEWTELDSWLRNRAPYSVGGNGARSFLGLGEQPMSEDEQAALAAWAETVAKRLEPSLELSAHSEKSVEWGVCPEVPRPAVSLFLPGEGYVIIDPISGQKCLTTLDGDIPGLFQAVRGAIYYTVLQDDQFVVKRIAQDGTPSLLPFTAVNRDDDLLYHSFVVSPDESRIAWSATSAGADDSGPEVSNLWVAGMGGGELVTLISESGSAEEERQMPVPVRFSKDNSTLFYTYQSTIGIGGIWNAYTGRYNNLYALPLSPGAEAMLVFECAGEHNRLCIGDFIALEGQATTLAYVQGNSVIILNDAGEVLNTLAPGEEYVGYPTFGPTGELVFYGADLDQGPNASIMPLNGTIYRVAPLTAPQEVLASDPGLFLPRDWLDPVQIVVGYVGSNEAWGMAIVDLLGSLQIVDAEPNGIYVSVLSR